MSSQASRGLCAASPAERKRFLIQIGCPMGAMDLPDHAVVARITEKLLDYRLLHSCITCLHFDEPSEQCMKFNARPPARIIAIGCQAWEEDLPF